MYRETHEKFVAGNFARNMVVSLCVAKVLEHGDFDKKSVAAIQRAAKAGRQRSRSQRACIQQGEVVDALVSHAGDPDFAALRAGALVSAVMNARPGTRSPCKVLLYHRLSLFLP